MGNHSVIGASSMKRWQACPGSVRMCDGVEGEDSEYAKEGTAAHALAEECLRPMLEGVPPQHPFDFAGGEKDGVLVTEEMCDAVLEYVSHVSELAANGISLRIEAKLHLASIDPRLWGTCDASVYRPDTKELHVIDYKHGAGVAVEAEGNPQLMYYALGVLMAEPLDVETLVLTVVQPRCWHPQGAVRSWRVPVTDMIEWSFELEKAAKATKDPNAPLNAGEHCRWCPAAGFCPELERVCMSTVAEHQDATKYDPEHLAEVHAKLPMVEAWIKSVRSWCWREAMAGRVLPRHKLTAGKKSRSWKDEKAAAEFLVMYGMDEKDIYTEPALKSVAQIEKITRDKKALESLVDVKEGSPRLVPEDSPGEAADVSPQKAFASFID